MSKIIEEPVENTKPSYLRKTMIAIKKISEILEDIIIENENNDISSENRCPKINDFSCKKPPQISIFNYLKRIVKYGQPVYSSLLLSLIYIDKLIETKDFILTRLNIHR